MPQAIAIDTSALDRLQVGFDFELDWFNDWSSGSLPQDVSRIEIGGTVFLLGPGADADSKLLVVEVARSGLFAGLSAKLRPEAFFRVVRMGRSAHSRGRLPIPTSWLPYHARSLVSIQSNHQSTQEKARIEFDLNPRDSGGHVFAYKLDRSRHDLATTKVDYELFDAAVARLDDAVLAMLSLRDDAPTEVPSRMVLSALDDRISMGSSLKDWLDGRLTQAQQEFIDAPLEKSIRLVGAAGTGKTLSLIIKSLSEFRKRVNDTDGFRCLFLTHSQSTVDTVTNAIASMDHEGLTQRREDSFLKVCTLQELANEAMKYDLHGLEPLSNDGLEGRVLQIEAIEAQIEAIQKGDWITYRERCSDAFRSAFSAQRGSPEARSFAFEVMNEFACVLEADGVRQSSERREKYLNEPRKGWMMSLANVEDRQVVLRIYDLFREFLRQIGVIGVDQMISDYLGFLDSNRWDNVRRREGFDVVFVDELQLFNRQERMTLHHLMRDISGPPIIVMAYDSKQSIRDTFYGLAEASGGSSVFARDMGLGPTERFELTEAFRYTPEIARVLEWIDQTFPAAGLSEELGVDWRPMALGSRAMAGDRPVLYKARNSLEIFNTVFPRAQRAARDLQKGRRVAVLCASEALFRRYAESGAYRDQFLAITDKEQVASLRHAGKRFVFSMPEFVSGIQFDTVFLIETNEGEVPQGPYATGALRRYVSLLYLGASRAERVLELYSSDERGGPTRALKHAVERGALDVLNVRDI